MYKDLDSYVVFALDGVESDCVATCRIIMPGISYADAASIGRVCVAPRWRGKGLGSELVHRALCFAT